MKNLLVLTLCLALTGLVRAEQPNDKEKGKAKGKNQPATATSNLGQGKGHQTLSNTSQLQKHNVSTPNSLRSNTHVQSNAQLQSNTKLHVNTNPWKVQKLAIQKNTNISPVHFNGGVHISGSQNWQGSNYNAFRLYTSQRHDRDWWNHNQSRIILVGGGYYYWNSGYWYPAWGYDPNYEFYAYDGPIYGYNSLPPDQVIGNVQAALQSQGYYQGQVDGMLGPLTRAALANYQRDHNLYITSAIDQPTLATLGMS